MRSAVAWLKPKTILVKSQPDPLWIGLFYVRYRHLEAPANA